MSQASFADDAYWSNVAGKKRYVVSSEDDDNDDETQRKKQKVVKPTICVPSIELIKYAVKEQLQRQELNLLKELIDIICGYCFGYIMVRYENERIDKIQQFELDPFCLYTANHKEFVLYPDRYLMVFLCSEEKALKKNYYTHLRNSSFFIRRGGDGANGTFVDDFRPRRLADIEEECANIVSSQHFLKIYEYLHEKQNRPFLLKQLKEMKNGKGRPWNIIEIGNTRYPEYMIGEISPDTWCTGISPVARYGYGFSGGWNYSESCLVFDSWFVHIPTVQVVKLSRSSRERAVPSKALQSTFKIKNGNCLSCHEPMVDTGDDVGPIWNCTNIGCDNSIEQYDENTSSPPFASTEIRKNGKIKGK